MRSLLASPWPKPACLMLRARSRRWPSPSCTEMAASLASIMMRFDDARSRVARVLESAELSSRARRSRKARRHSSSTRVMMPSVMAWVTPRFHPSSRARSMSSLVAWERLAMSERDSRRAASLKECSVAT